MMECENEGCTNPPAEGTSYCTPCLRFAMCVLMGFEVDFAQNLSVHPGPVEVKFSALDDRGVTVDQARVELKLRPELFGTTVVAEDPEDRTD